MPFLRNLSLLAALGFVTTMNVQAQQPASPPSPSSPPAAKASASGGPAVDDAFVQKNFGSSCTLMPGPAPLVADLDGDGIDDVVIVARCKNPLVDQTDDNYKVIDPYNTYFGYGDPKISTQFASEDPETRGIALLVIHGAGPEAWRSGTPKAKFMIINLPFKELTLKKMEFHKKKIMAIYAAENHEGEGTVSVVFWDGKRWKYEPLGSSME